MFDGAEQFPRTINIRSDGIDAFLAPSDLLGMGVEP